MNPITNKAGSAVSALRRKQAKKSIHAFAKTYMAHHFLYSLSSAHLEIFKLFIETIKNRGKKIAFAAPRGFGKSTLVTLIYVIYCICYSKSRFTVIISETSGQAEQLLENIKKELVENELLMTDFPELFEYRGRPKPPRWTQSQIETRSGIKILALGAQQPITGRKYGKYRPDLIILDDIESANKIYSSETAEKMNDWFTKSVLKAGDESTTFVFIGTIHHPCCFFASYIKTPLWDIRKYKAIIDEPKHSELWSKCFNIKNGKDEYNGKNGLVAARDYYTSQKTLMDERCSLLWPARWSIFDLMNMRDDDLVSFSAEYQNEPLDIKMALLRIDTAQYWNRRFKSLEDLLHYLGDNAEFYLACDPSVGLDATRGDYSAIIVIACDRRDNVLYVLIADIERRDLFKTIEDILAYARRFDFSKIGVEANGFQETEVRLLEREADKERFYRLPVERIKNMGDKHKRIGSLALPIKSGKLQLNEEHKVLLEQMQFFPHAKYDDGPDALEMCVRLAEGPGGVQVLIPGGRIVG